MVASVKYSEQNTQSILNEQNNVLPAYVPAVQQIQSDEKIIKTEHVESAIEGK